MFSIDSFGGLADTVCTYRVLGHVVWSFIARSTRYPLAMMSTRSEQRAPFTGVRPQRVSSRSRHLGTLIRCAADWLFSCTCAMVPQVRTNRMGPSLILGSQRVRKKIGGRKYPVATLKRRGVNCDASCGRVTAYASVGLKVVPIKICPHHLIELVLQLFLVVRQLHRLSKGWIHICPSDGC